MKKILIILLHALLGWIWCGTIMGLGPQIMSMDLTLMVHAIGGPLGFAVLSAVYHRKFAYTTPMQTAAIFIGFVIVMDVMVVAWLIQDSFAMFASPLGTWIPFVLIFCATLLAGKRTFCRPAEG